MANSTAGKFWLLDTAGVVVDTAVKVKNVQITWKVASAGTVNLSTFSREDGTGQAFCYAASSGATSAATNELTQIVPIDAWVPGVQLVTVADVAKLIVQID